MIARIRPRPLRGEARAIPSKSEAHRLLICAALADAPSKIVMGEGSEDIEATVRCLRALGARIEREADGLHVRPIERAPEPCEADCGESGSTLRFLLPVAAALGADVRFRMHGRLPQRPIAPLDRELARGGCELSRPAPDVIRIRGRLRPGAYALPGDVSSQYISGMLMALSALDARSELRVEGRLESAGYVEITCAALASFGAPPERAGQIWRAGGARLRSPGEVRVGGDWSNAAFWLCAAALPGCDVRVRGLDAGSAQGDRRIVDEIARLRTAGADECVRVDASNIPDLIPAIAACACGRGQRLAVVNAARLRIKESDRLRAICAALRALGGALRESADALEIEPAPLLGGEVDAFGDHRIAMMAAIASAACAGEVRIRGAEAVNKSYPGFWRDFAALGGEVEQTEEDA